MKPMIQKVSGFRLVAFLIGGTLLTGSLLGLSGEPYNGFDLSRHSVPLEEILSGGPPRDGIPAILHPRFVSAGEAKFLHAEDRVLGIRIQETAKAYPLKILNWHEIVNDAIEGRMIAVTYCPLCGTGIGFERVMRGRTVTFGVSGLLYQSDMLMYDHQTDSLWSQIAMEAISGPLMGEKLQPVFLEHTTWKAWRRRHPHTLVLSTETGYTRHYDRDPYLGYAQRADLMFPISHVDDRYPAKTWVLGLEVNGVFKAYPFPELIKVPTPVQDTVNGQMVTIHYHDASKSAKAMDHQGHPMVSVMAYWFAWSAFHPETEVFSVSQPAP